ncbi:hypothetical protein ZWY2020_038320 [Hordeum vulgare]|nr:hypothetical protein ZWY2020_038320 [Hordeum vulgare]
MSRPPRHGNTGSGGGGRAAAADLPLHRHVVLALNAPGAPIPPYSTSNPTRRSKDDVAQGAAAADSIPSFSEDEKLQKDINALNKKCQFKQNRRVNTSEFPVDSRTFLHSPSAFPTPRTSPPLPSATALPSPPSAEARHPRGISPRQPRRRLLLPRRTGPAGSRYPSGLDSLLAGSRGG